MGKVKRKKGGGKTIEPYNFRKKLSMGKSEISQEVYDVVLILFNNFIDRLHQEFPDENYEWGNVINAKIDKHAG